MGLHTLLFVFALLASLGLTPLVRAFAGRVGVIDRPDGRRKLHATPIPKLGGIAVFTAFYSCLWLVATMWDDPGLRSAMRLASAMFFPSLLIMMLGIADDRRPVRPWLKIAVQLVAGMLVFYFLDIRIKHVSIPFVDSSVMEALSLPMTLFWIVFITNAFNLVDGMDGLAAGVAFIALTTMFFVSFLTQHPELALVVAPLAGAVLGFLKYNYNPASIFLGDSGSLFLGFQLAVLSVAGSQKASTAVAVAVPLLILALPLIETATSMLRRFLTGKSILKADAGHIHHQLVRLGFTPRRAAGILYLGSGAFGLVSLFVIQNGGTAIGLVAVTLSLVTWVGIQQLGYAEFAEVNSAFRRFLNQRRIIRNSIISRQLAEELAAASSLPDAWQILKQAARRLSFSAVELRVNADYLNKVEAAEHVWFAERLQPSSKPDPHTETSFAVALTSARGTMGEVVFTRPLAAQPLHSELSLLMSAVAQGLPLVGDKAASVSASSAQPRPAAVDRIAHTRSGATGGVCRACGMSGLQRSRSRSSLDRLRKKLTAKRLHVCTACRRRTWTLPQTPRHAVLTSQAKDLQGSIG